MNILEVKNLTKKFGDVVAVDNISFELGEGEILGLLGHNGAGKTTTIQMLISVLTPTSGEIKYFGKNLVNNREEILENIGFSSTYTHLPHYLTVEDCFKYTSYFFDIKDRKKRIQEIKEIFEIDEFFEKDTALLSSGQMTKANLAKTFINFPKVLLLDEPTASLDPESARDIRNLLKKECERFKVSIIITSHNMAEIEELCDRVLFIDHGEIIADDSPTNLSKTVKVSHIELMIRDMDKIIEYCDKNNLKYKIDGKYIRIDIDEEKIANFLDDLSKNKIIYNEISIEKPTLEDYFLEVVGKKKNENQ